MFWKIKRLFMVWFAGRKKSKTTPKLRFTEFKSFVQLNDDEWDWQVVLHKKFYYSISSCCQPYYRERDHLSWEDHWVWFKSFADYWKAFWWYRNFKLNNKKYEADVELAQNTTKFINAMQKEIDKTNEEQKRTVSQVQKEFSDLIMKYS